MQGLIVHYKGFFAYQNISPFYNGRALEYMETNAVCCLIDKFNSWDCLWLYKCIVSKVKISVVLTMFSSHSKCFVTVLFLFSTLTTRSSNPMAVPYQTDDGNIMDRAILNCILISHFSASWFDTKCICKIHKSVLVDVFILIDWGIRVVMASCSEMLNVVFICLWRALHCTSIGDGKCLHFVGLEFFLYLCVSYSFCSAS